jgi:thiol-disulfide isomerase/thioredoxin
MAERTTPLSDRLGIALLVVVLGFVAWRFVRVDPVGPVVPPGTPMPPLNVDGWLNVADDEPFDPIGELVVVDLWATWCGPCIQDLPRMTLIAADYRRRGVKFVSITQETADDLPAIKATIERTPGFNWPIAYGGSEFTNQLAIRGIPTVILFGRDGKARWSGPGSYGLAAALDEALADSPAPAAH